MKQSIICIKNTFHQNRSNEKKNQPRLRVENTTWSLALGFDFMIPQAYVLSEVKILKPILVLPDFESFNVFLNRFFIKSFQKVCTAFPVVFAYACFLIDRLRELVSMHIL